MRLDSTPQNSTRAFSTLSIGLLVFVAALGLTSCGSTKVDPDEGGDKPGFWDVPRDIEIGEIQVVDKSGFVVIRNPANLAFPEGQRLYILGDGKESVLRLGIERTNTHLSADITQGEPEVGDIVVYYHRPGKNDADTWDELKIDPENIKAEWLDLDNPLPTY